MAHGLNLFTGILLLDAKKSIIVNFVYPCTLLILANSHRMPVSVCTYVSFSVFERTNALAGTSFQSARHKNMLRTSAVKQS